MVTDYWFLFGGVESSYVKYTFAQKKKKTKQIYPVSQLDKKKSVLVSDFARKNCDGKKGEGNIYN